VPRIPGLRPTPGRIRETLFNWLQPYITGANCLDLFAGSGALSFEALSRGASSVVAVDCQQQSIAALNHWRAELGAQGLQVRHERVERLLSSPPDKTFGIVFVDPPFDLQNHRSICSSLQENGWLSPAALIYVETADKSDFAHPDAWSVLRCRRAGHVAYRLLQAPGC
jgi:16S rRNA (guanine966-N2)-methyltransferase